MLFSHLWNWAYEQSFDLIITNNIVEQIFIFHQISYEECMFSLE